jgi:integrase
MVVKLNQTTNTKTKILIEHPQMDEIIKSARVYQKDGMIHLDYRVHPAYRRDGKERTRFSTGVAYSKRSMVRMEREKFQRALEHYLQHTSLLDGENLTVGDIALDALNDGKGNRQEDTHNDYLMIYELFIKPFFSSKVLREVKVLDIKRWKDSVLQNNKLSRGRYIKYQRCLNFIFQYALENELIDRNPVALVDKKSKLFTTRKKSLEEKYYTAKEVELMLSRATGWFKVMLVTYLNTGMRTGEGLALKWSDIDFEKCTITIQRSMRKGRLKDSTKTGEDRIVMMSQPLKETLLAYQKSCSSTLWLFPNPKTGEPYYEANSITKWYFKPLLEQCGIEYKTFYALRHTFASLSAQKNIPMSIISKQIGHRSVETTLRFYIKHNLLSDGADMHIFDTLYA